MKDLAKPGPRRFYADKVTRHPRLTGWLLAALVAGTLSTAVQLLLWLMFTDEWAALLLRDARLAAALLLGPSVLPPPASFDLAVMAVATAVHFALSLVYAGMVALLVQRQPAGRAVMLGAAFGLVLYLVNLHAFTRVFPWFAPARGWIAVVAHLAFGVVAAAAYRWAVRRRLA